MWQDLSVDTKIFDLVTLTLTFDLLLRKLNLGHNFWTKRDRAFIFHMCICCDKTFLPIPKFLTSWPWPWLLTYFWKNLTLAITFEPKEIGLSYFTCIFVKARPFCRYQNFWLRDLNLDFWPTLKKLNLGNNFWTKRDRAFIFHMFISCDKTFLLETNFFTSLTFTLTFDLLLKKLNLDHNFWIKSDRALILHIFIPCDKTFLLIPIFLT